MKIIIGGPSFNVKTHRIFGIFYQRYYNIYLVWSTCSSVFVLLIILQDYLTDNIEQVVRLFLFSTALMAII